jgi:hypothetical protein
VLIQYFALLGVYTLIVFWILGFTYFFRHRITCMAGMMIAMTLGMMIGLGFGTLIGMAYPEQLFQATAISVFIGAIVGFIAGLPISLMAVLDGLLSGLMGGMMGAMLGVMIPSESIDSVAKTMAVLSVGILFILFLMIQGEIKFKDHDNKWKKLFFGKPQPLFLVICIFIIMINQFQFAQINAEARHLSQMNDDTGKNEGKLEHDFEIVGTDLHVHAQPGTQNSLSFSLKEPGKYNAICTLPGHQEAGMLTILEVF